MDKVLDGSPTPVQLGPGLRLRAPGVKGKVSTRSGTDLRTRSSSRGVDDGLDALDAALANTNTTETCRVDLQVAPRPASTVRTTRGPRTDTGNEIELEAPDLGPDVGQIAMSIDDAGAVRWHLPEPRAPGASTRRRASDGIVFRIPLHDAPAQEAAPGAASRSVLGAASKRLLKVFVYPITDPIVGSIAEFIAQRWEQDNRPHRLRSFTPTDYASPNGTPVTAEALADMAKAGPVLLFVHGTFSTAHGGFGGLPRATMQALHDRYGGRVVAFDHPTLGTGPRENVAWLRSQLPDVPVVFDIVCHSRGGLVSRTLAESADGEASVRKLVLAGAPNNGTLLADPDHMVAMIDRLTTALTLLPGGAVVETLEALVTAVKTLGHGGLKGLDGLRSMCPDGAFLQELNIEMAQPGDYFAIAAHYEPTDRGLRSLVMGGVDAVADRIFGDADNDLVVPTEGVYDKNGSSRFPVAEDRRLVLPPSEGVMHTSLFGHRDVSARLLQWLQ